MDFAAFADKINWDGLTYLVVDLESTGFSRREDLVTQAAWAEVRDGQIVDTDSVVLNWFDDQEIDSVWLANRLAYVAERLAAKGREMQITAATLHAGVSPRLGLRRFVERLQAAEAEGMRLVGHNVIGFDFPFLTAAAARHLQSDWQPDLNRVCDSGLLVKAIQLQYALPASERVLADWYAAVRKVYAPGVKWSLDEYCVQQYDLSVPGAAHNALTDVALVHALLTRLREHGLPRPSQTRDGS